MTAPSTTSLDDLAAYISGTGSRNRKRQLPYSSIDDAALRLKTGGVVSGYVGTQFDGTTGVMLVNGPTPPRPSAPIVTTTLGGITVRWDGGFNPAVITGGNGAATPVFAPGDFKGVEVQVSESATFEGANNARGPLLTSAAGGDTFIPWPNYQAHVYVRLVVRATTGKASPPGPVTEATTGGEGGVAFVPDTMPPGQVTGLALSTYTAPDATGVDQGIIMATWTETGQNADGTLMDDLSHYLVHWRWNITSGVFDWQSTTTTVPGVQLPAATGLPYTVRAAAVDRSGNVGAWSTIMGITVAKDTTPPKAPQAPTVSNYLGQLRITWSGLMEDLSDPPIDFAFVEVHVGTTSTFSPVQGTRVAQLAAGGEAYAVAPYATTRYVRLYAYDLTGNRSVSSVVVAGSTSKVVSDDLFAGAVGNAALANLAVRTANIDLLAVNTAQVGQLDVGRLVSGTMTADVVMAGRMTTALTGARTEMNTLGFQKWRADGTKAISITDTETLLTGWYKSAETGRRIEMGVSGAMGQVSFISPNNITAFVKGYTEPNAMDSIQVGIDQRDLPNPHFLFGRTNWNENGHINTHARWLINGFTEGFRVESYTSRTTYNADNPPSTGSIYRLAIDNNGYYYRDAANRLRVMMDADTTALFGYDGIQFMDRPSGLARLIRFTPDGVNPFNGSFEISHNAGQSQQSARVALVQPDLGGTMLKSWQSGCEVRDLQDLVFRDMRALGFVTMSDSRWKSNIVDSTLDASAAVKAMRVRSYTVTKAKPSGGKETEEVAQIGLLAQEAQAAGVPVVSTAGSDGSLGIDQYQYVTVLAKAVQELIARVEALEKPGKAKV